jgi:hypothetical protein
MSGSGGGGGPDIPRFSCEDLMVDTHIASPKADVVSKLKKGDVLQVALETKGATAVVVLLLGKRVAGGIASPALNQLRECIQGGHQYKATVTGIKGAEILIRIDAA